MAKTKWPRPPVYKTVADIVKANRVKEFYTRYMEPSSILYGIRIADGTYKWYEYDRNANGFVMRATTLWSGPARIFPASEASTAMGDVAESFPRRPGESMKAWIRRLNIHRGATDSDPFADRELGVLGMKKIPWGLVAGVALAGTILWLTRPIKT